jgi:hypothetical protein
MQVAGDKAAAILGVDGGVGSAGAGAETIGVVKVGVVRVSAEVGMVVSAEVAIEVGTEVGIKVGAKVRMATTKEIRGTGPIRRTGLIAGVFGGFEVRVRSSGKS